MYRAYLIWGINKEICRISDRYIHGILNFVVKQLCRISARNIEDILNFWEKYVSLSRICEECKGILNCVEK